MHIPPAAGLFVIFGGTGDLAERKLMPALFHLAKSQRVPKEHRILALGRSAEITTDSYRDRICAALREAGYDVAECGAWCANHLEYLSVPEVSAEQYGRLRLRIEEIEEKHGLPGNRIFYLALPPRVFGQAIETLGEVGLAEAPGEVRIVVEKPFGRDLGSAEELNRVVHRRFQERQVYRIDHYLGKETVQNLHVFRFGNTIFEDLWNRDRVESVQITVAESLGVEDRAAFYEKAGALRDIVQNHMMQLLCLVAMEAPLPFDAEAIRHEKVKVLRAIQPILARDVVFGQYGPGRIDEQPVAGYREEEGVSPDSRTETFFALRLFIDSWRWQGVPFYLRTGKRMTRKLTEIAVVYRRPPVCMFESVGYCPVDSNVLYITLQPNEGFTLTMDVKEPGEPLSLRRIPLQFRYAEEFGALPDAYETLLLDVFEGDQTLFVHSDEVEASWRLFSPLLDGRHVLHPYAAGSWGPRAASDLLAREGHSWRLRRP